MQHFPLNINLKGRPVVIIGGGAVAWRKCRQLLEAHPHITVIAPDLSPPLQQAAESGKIDHIGREFLPGDVAGAFLVFAATDQPDVNKRVATEAIASGVLVSVADNPDLGNFTMPAILTRGDLLVAVSTSGNSPGFSRAIRDRLANEFGVEYASVVLLLGRIREKLLTESGLTEYNNKILNDFIAIDLPALFRDKNISEIDRLLVQHFGSNFCLEKLGLRQQDLL